MRRLLVIAILAASAPGQSDGEAVFEPYRFEFERKLVSFALEAFAPPEQPYAAPQNRAGPSPRMNQIVDTLFPLETPYPANQCPCMYFRGWGCNCFFSFLPGVHRVGPNGGRVVSPGVSMFTAYPMQILHDRHARRRGYYQLVDDLVFDLY